LHHCLRRLGDIALLLSCVVYSWDGYTRFLISPLYTSFYGGYDILGRHHRYWRFVLASFFALLLLLFVSLRSFISPPFTWKRNLLVSEIGPCNGSLSEMAWVRYTEMYDGFLLFLLL